jgi:hypothetical protein
MKQLAAVVRLSVHHCARQFRKATGLPPHQYVRTLADVGGGLGGNLTRILGRYPAMRGVLFDQPHVVARALPLLEASGVWGRCVAEGGDFFATAPSLPTPTCSATSSTTGTTKSPA